MSRLLRGWLLGVDSNYATHPISTLMHVLPGAADLGFGALQFSASFRRRHLRWHRVAGRCLIIIAAAGSLSALALGLVTPFAGNRERVVITIFAVWWLVTTLAGYAAIRCGERRAHREWMIRGWIVSVFAAEVWIASTLDAAHHDAGDVVAL